VRSEHQLGHGLEAKSLQVVFLQMKTLISEVPCSDGGLQEQAVSNLRQEVTKTASSLFCPFACSWRCPSCTALTEDQWLCAVSMTDPMGCTSDLPEMGYGSTPMDEEAKHLLNTIPSGLVFSEEADLDQAL